MSNYWTALRQRKISRRTMLGASAKAGVGAAGLALVGCGGDDDDDGGAGDAAAAEAAAAAGDSSAAAAAAERAAAAAEAAAAAAAAAGDAGAAAVAEAAAAAAEAAAAAAREAGADQAQAAAEAAAAAAAAAEDAAAAAREAADAATAAGEEEEEQAVAVGRFDTQATLRIGYPAFPASLDVNMDQGGAAVTNTLHFDPPFAHDKGRQWLASGGYVGWEFVDQNTAALLTVQPDVFFHNGEQLNAERLKWFYERNLGIAEYNPDYVSGIRARMAFIDDLQVVDDLTLRVGMDPPSVNMPEQLGGGTIWLTPRDYIVDNGDEFFARNPVGTGPYTFVSFTPDQEMVSVRWDDWFFPNPADEGPHDKYGNWVKTVTARYFPEESARIAALEAGEIDVAERLSPDGAALFADSDDHHVLTVPGLRVMGLELPINQSLDPITGGPNPWRDKRVREAANYALDKQLIIDNLLTGLELPAVSPFPAGYPLPLGPSGLRGYDPDKARALLEEAGQVGFQFRFHIGTGIWGDERWMPAIQQMLNDVGFDVVVDYLDFGGALADIRDHAVPNPFLMSSNGATKHGSPSGAGFAYSLIAAIGNPYAHTNADDDFLPEFVEFQAILDEANVTFDEQRRNDLYWDAAVIHYEEAFNIPLFNLTQQHGARKDISYQGWTHGDHSLNVRYLGVST